MKKEVRKQRKIIDVYAVNKFIGFFVPFKGY